MALETDRDPRQKRPHLFNLAVTADTTNAIISTPESSGPIELLLHLTPKKEKNQRVIVLLKLLRCAIRLVSSNQMLNNWLKPS